MRFMKRRTLLLSIVLGTALFASYPGLTQVQKVYILPMSSGLDQYLAESLTRHHQYQVVTDPKTADTSIFTDKVGEAFEKRLLELYSRRLRRPKTRRRKKKKKPTRISRLQKDKTDSMSLKSEPMVRLGGFSAKQRDGVPCRPCLKNVIWSFYKLPRRRPMR